MSDSYSESREGERSQVGRPAPAYLTLLSSGELEARAAALGDLLDPCVLCPHLCGAHRRDGEVGVCGLGPKPVLANACAHHGEEPPLSGLGGAGTLFFAGCNLGCRYCQNHAISFDPGAGRPVSPEALAVEMLALQRRGCENVEWVTGTPVLPALVQGLALAARQGFRLPIVHNTSGFDRVEVLRLLDGVVDIYLPDLKYARGADAARWSGAPDYPARSRAALHEMLRQVGPLLLDERGVAVRGVLIRHLVLPGGVSATPEVLRFIAQELGRDVPVSLMAQYAPPPDLARDLGPPLDRGLTREEYEVALTALHDLGLEEGYVQDLISAETYVPHFECEGHPFESEA